MLMKSEKNYSTVVKSTEFCVVVSFLNSFIIRCKKVCVNELSGSYRSSARSN